MSFASLPFLFVFLPVFLLCYGSALFLRANIRTLNGIALLFSGAFFTWGAPRFVPVLLLSCFIDYALSNQIAETPPGTRKQRTLLSLSVVLNVGLLLYFKYANFFVSQLNGALTAFGHEPFPWAAVVLPIGISFITFEKLSYIFDVARRVTAPAPNFLTYLLFIALFPHLIAGPIFRYHDMAEQLVNRRHRLDRASSGALRFILGLSKKVLIADPLAGIADQIFALAPAELSFGRSWLGILAYSYQIYFDFSGYSDMAIGLGRMMGFEFIENFNHPYISRSITEFWRRWHISLSNWLREYLYFPLGGSRCSPARTAANLWIVFLVSGFWHGANWTFILWGCYHGFFLMLDRLFLLRLLQRLPSAVQTAFTFLVVMCGWVLFRAESLEQAGSYLHRMFVPDSATPPANLPLLLAVDGKIICIFAVATVASFLPAADGIFSRLRNAIADRGAFQFACLGFAAAVALIFSAAALTDSTFHPFIYFRF